MSQSPPSLNEFKANIEALFGQPLTEPASQAAEDFWKHWSSFDTLIAQHSLAVHVDPLRLGQNFPQYKRYHVWKGAGIISILLGIASIWFLWQLGAVFVASGIGLHLHGSRLRSRDAKNFAEEISNEATLDPSSGYARLCANYIAGTVQLASPVGTARWPQFPSDVIATAHQ